VWVHVDGTKDIHNPSWDSINLVEPRAVTKSVVIVAPSNNGMDAASIRHEKSHIICGPSNTAPRPKDQRSHSSSRVRQPDSKHETLATNRDHFSIFHPTERARSHQALRTYFIYFPSRHFRSSSTDPSTLSTAWYR
jgi:hypothetical protein